MSKKSGLALALTMLAFAAQAADQDEEALSLLPAVASKPAENSRPWQLSVEGAAGHEAIRPAPLTRQTHDTQQLSVDLQIDTTLRPGLRAVLANRFDSSARDGFATHRSINTLKEAYLSFQPRQDAIIDVGRINQYSGVATGYNPTDFFREGALRSPLSVDPTLIKKNRQGSVMLRGQALWEGASLTALYSPALSGARDAPALHTHWDATNRSHRGLLIFSHQLTQNLNPQWLLYMEQGQPLQWGMNLTKLLNDATVAYVEWAGGRRPTLLAQSLGQDSDKAFRNRLATGLTYTTSNKLSLTLEYHYNGAGLRTDPWKLLPQTSAPSYGRYRQYVQWAQDSPTRHEMMLYGAWRDAGMSNLDLTWMVRLNQADHSRLSWAELRYKWPRDEIAFQWLGNTGHPLSVYGASPLRETWALSYRHFF